MELVLLPGLVLLIAICLVLFLRVQAARAEIASLRVQVQELSRKRTDFVANVSHELKTPLTSIQGFAETLRNGAIKDPQKSVEFLDKILEHTNRLDRLTHDILELSRLEASDQHLSFETIALPEFLKALKEDFQIRLDQKNQSLVIDNEVNEIVADRHLLEQAFSNLVSNAIRYCPEGALIEIVGRRQNIDGKPYVVFEVIDNGPGLAAEDLPRIFERFYRADKSRNRAFGGTGLGLAIVKHIVLSHGGKVAAENKATGGMRFRMSFPEERA